MPIRYYKLFDRLNRSGMKKTDLLDILSPNTLAKLSKGESVSTPVLASICAKLHCDIGDIAEYEFDASDLTKQTSKSRTTDK